MDEEIDELSEFFQTISINNTDAIENIKKNGYINLQRLTSVPPTDEDLKRYGFEDEETDAILQHLKTISQKKNDGFVPATWEWQSDEGWKAYDQEISDAIEAANVAGLKSFPLNIGWFSGKGYSIDLQKLCQVNPQTNGMRRIRKLGVQQTVKSKESLAQRVHALVKQKKYKEALGVYVAESGGQIPLLVDFMKVCIGTNLPAWSQVEIQNAYNEYVEESCRTPYDTQELCDAAFKGDVKKVDAILKDLQEKKGNVNANNNRGQSALYCAAREGHLEIVRKLLKVSEIDINSVDVKGGSTALHAASFASHPKVIQILLKKGADINIENKAGLLPREEARSKEARDAWSSIKVPGESAIDKLLTSTRSSQIVKGKTSENQKND